MSNEPSQAFTGCRIEAPHHHVATLPCPICGVPVADEARHLEWHEDLDRWFLELKEATAAAEAPETPPDAPTAPPERPYVWITPARMGGDACLGGTRVPTGLVAGMVDNGASVEDVGHDYNLNRGQVLMACWFEAFYGDGRQEWVAWAEHHYGALARGEFDGVPLPTEWEAP